MPLIASRRRTGTRSASRFEKLIAIIVVIITCTGCAGAAGADIRTDDGSASPDTDPDPLRPGDARDVSCDRVLLLSLFSIARNSV